MITLLEGVYKGAALIEMRRHWPLPLVIGNSWWWWGTEEDIAALNERIPRCKHSNNNSINPLGGAGIDPVVIAAVIAGAAVP